jgi:hypothetical protein
MRAARTLPWPNVSVAMVEEQRMLSLARDAGPEGAAMATTIMDEIERLFAADEAAAIKAAVSAR